MDSLAKKGLKYGKAVYTAVNSAVSNPEQFLHGQQGQQGQQQQRPPQQHQQQYQPQQVPHQYNPQQPPPYPPRPGTHSTPSPGYGNGPHQYAQSQQQLGGYNQNLPLPPRPGSTNPYPPSSQPLNPQFQQENQQWTGHIPAAPPYSPHSTNPQPAWSQNQQPPHPAFSPVQTSQPYSPPPTGAFSPPPSGNFSAPPTHMSPPPPVSPMATSSTPVSHPFSPPPSAFTPAPVSPPPAPHIYPGPSDNGQFQGHNTPSPVSHAQGFASQAGLSQSTFASAHPSTSYAGSSTAPSSIPNQNGPGSQQNSFIAELPADVPTGPVEMLAELPGDLLPSNPVRIDGSAGGLTQVPLVHDNGTKPNRSTLGGDQVAGPQGPSSTAHASNLPTNAPGESYSSPVIPTAAVTPTAHVQQPTPVHPQGNSLTHSNPTPPPAQWQAPPAATPPFAYNPSRYPSIPGSGPTSPQNQSPYQPYTAEPASYAPHGQQQHPTSSTANDQSNQNQYGQPAIPAQMSSLAQKAQQLSLNGQINPAPQAQYQAYYATGSGEQGLPQGPTQQQSFGLPAGHPQQQQQGQQIAANPNGPAYQPYVPPPAHVH